MPRKGVKQAAVDAPELIPGKRILCKIQGTPRGSNIFEASDGTDIFIVQLPNRYRKSLWVRPGSYVIVELLEGNELKVGGEIVHVLLADEVKERRKGSDWPIVLDTIGQTNESTKTETTEASDAIENEEAEKAAVGSDEDDDLWHNTNRR